MGKARSPEEYNLSHALREPDLSKSGLGREAENVVVCKYKIKFIQFQKHEQGVNPPFVCFGVSSV